MAVQVNVTMECVSIEQKDDADKYLLILSGLGDNSRRVHIPVSRNVAISFRVGNRYNIKVEDA